MQEDCHCFEFQNSGVPDVPGTTWSVTATGSIRPTARQPIHNGCFALWPLEALAHALLYPREDECPRRLSYSNLGLAPMLLNNVQDFGELTTAVANLNNINVMDYIGLQASQMDDIFFERNQT